MWINFGNKCVNFSLVEEIKFYDDFIHDKHVISIRLNNNYFSLDFDHKEDRDKEYDRIIALLTK